MSKARLLLGREAAVSLDQRTSEAAAALKAAGITPALAIVRCGENASDLAYEAGVLKRSKAAGIEVRRVILKENCEKESLIREIHKLNEDPGVHGVLMFRPLPKALKPYEGGICNELSPEKDVDCMTDLSNAGVYEGKELGFPPCTPSACMEILDYYGIDLEGKNVAVIGRSLVVGRPLAMMLMARHATVTICHTRTRDLPSITRRADVIVSSAGVLNSLTAEHVREGQVVIDVSINWDPSGKGGKGGIAGDAAFDEIEGIAGAITPVPGGVGAVTTSVLFSHVVTAAQRQKGKG